MKLLSVQEVKTAKQKEQDILVAKETRLVVAIDTKSKELQQLRETQEADLRRLQLEMMGRIAVLRQEISILEYEKQQFLGSAYVQEIEEREKQLTERETLAERLFKARKEEMQQATDRIAVSDKALNVGWEALDERKANILNRESTLEARESQSISAEIALNAHIQAVNDDLQARMQAMASQEQRSQRKTERLDAREVALDAKEDDLAREADRLEAERLHLESQQQSLKLAFDEARKRGIL